MMKITHAQARQLGLMTTEGVRVKLASMSGLPPLIESRIQAWCHENGLPAPTPELRFDPIRKWAFDFAWPHAKVAIELEGGTRIRGGGRHNRAIGFEFDCAKYNAAALAGWIVLRYTTRQMAAGQWMPDLVAALAQRQGAA